MDTVVPNPAAEPAPPWAAAKPAIIVYGKRAGTTITVCTDNHCLIHAPPLLNLFAEIAHPRYSPVAWAYAQAVKVVIWRIRE